MVHQSPSKERRRERETFCPAHYIPSPHLLSGDLPGKPAIPRHVLGCPIQRLQNTGECTLYPVSSQLQAKSATGNFVTATTLDGAGVKRGWRYKRSVMYEAFGTVWGVKWLMAYHSHIYAKLVSVFFSNWAVMVLWASGQPHMYHAPLHTHACEWLWNSGMTGGRTTAERA